MLERGIIYEWGLRWNEISLPSNVAKKGAYIDKLTGSIGCCKEELCMNDELDEMRLVYSICGLVYGLCMNDELDEMRLVYPICGLVRL